MYKDNKDIDAIIYIEKGEVRVDSMNGSKGAITDELAQLLVVRDVVASHVKNFEKNFQKKFIPNENTIYKLPKEEI